jgi:hypothetical protein
MFFNLLKVEVLNLLEIGVIKAIIFLYFINFSLKNNSFNF